MAFAEDKLLSKYSAHVSGYKTACEENPSLKSFDSSLHQETLKMIDSLTAQAETGSLSLQSSHMEVHGFVAQLNQTVVNMIIERKEDVWENDDLRSLAKLYFDNAIKTLDFFNTTGNCLNYAESSQNILQFAVQLSKKEEKDMDVGEKKKKYENTLQELRNFETRGDPFDGEYKTRFTELCKQHELFLKEVTALKEKLDSKYGWTSFWRIFSNVLFGVGCVLTVVTSALLFLVGAPLVGIAVFLLAPLVALGGVWANSALAKKEELARREVEMAATIDSKKLANQGATETLDQLVKQLKTKNQFILDSLDQYTHQRESVDATEFVIKIIESKLQDFTKKIKEVRDQVDNFSSIVVLGNMQVLAKIVSFDSSKQKP